MKKRHTGRTVLLAVLALVVVGVLAAVAAYFLLGKKTAVTPEKFIEVLTAHDIPYEDITAELALETKEYEQGLFGEGTDPASYVQAEYYRLVSESAAQRFFGSVKAAFEAQKGNVSGSTSAELGNYAIYSLTTNGSYYYIARVDQTVVIFVADKSCKDQVKAMCKAMGY